MDCVCADLHVAGTDAKWLVADPSDLPGLDATVGRFEAMLGGVVSILVNAAGGKFREPYFRDRHSLGNRSSTSIPRK